MLNLVFGGRSIPALFLILGWGYQPERVQAGIYLLFYTLLASLPLLVGILFIYNYLSSLCLFLLIENNSLVVGLYCHLWPAPALQNFSTLSHKRKDFLTKATEHKMSVVRFSL